MSEPGSTSRGLHGSVANVWRSYWQAHATALGASAPDYLVEAVASEIGDAQGLRILEAGSGTGGLSQALAAHGAHVHLLDIIPDCVKRGRVGKITSGVVADLFHMPFPDRSFDCVFNSGVMEHFSPEDISRGFAELARVTKPGGRLIVIVPSSQGRFYVSGKAHLEATGRWEYGDEYPQDSLMKFGAACSLQPLRERLIGVRWQIRFLDGWRRRLASLLVAPFSENSRIGAQIFGGYLLVSSWIKQ
jgi:SAM-dependent methyltransferase